MHQPYRDLQNLKFPGLYLFPFAHNWLGGSRTPRWPRIANSKKFHEKNFRKKLVAKRRACLQPDKTHGYQYPFAVQFFNSYVYRGRINKGYLAGLDKVFKIRDRHHRICCQTLRNNEGQILIPAQS